MKTESEQSLKDILDSFKINWRVWTSWAIWLSLSLLIFFLAFFQIPGAGQDWKSYNSFFEVLRNEKWGVLSTSRFEPGFIILSIYLTNLFASNLSVFGVIAAGAMFLKCWAINRISLNQIICFATALFYLVRFAPLHELTQLRIACSGAFLLLAFVLRWESNRLGALFACLAALAFHVTALIIIPPLLFMRFKSRTATIFIGILIFFATLLGLEITTNYFQDMFFVIRMYQEAGFGEQVPNKLSTVLLLDWAMVIIGFILWNHITPMMKHILLLQVIGLALFYGALDFPVVAHRSREFLSIFWVLFIGQGLQSRSVMKEFSILFVILNLLLYSVLFSNNFFDNNV